MKRYGLYILFIAILLVGGIISQIYRPRQFNWNPNYEHTSTQPFGCAVFDSVVSNTMPHGYRVTGETLYGLSKDSTHIFNVLMVGESFAYSYLDFESLFKMLDRGSKVMLVADWFSSSLCDTIGLEENFPDVSDLLQNELDKKKMYDAICMADSSSSSVYPHRDYLVLSDLLRYGFHIIKDDTTAVTDKKLQADTSDVDTLAYSKEEFAETDTIGMDVSMDSVMTDSAGNEMAVDTLEYRPRKRGDFVLEPFVWMKSENPRKGSIAMIGFKTKAGKGELYVLQTPHLFTNYGMLSHNYHDYIFRCLNPLKDRELVRIDESLSYEVRDRQGNHGPFAFMLGQPPLRWALYLAVCIILLFLCFTARRKQRAIPVVRPPQNMQLKFVKFIGTLYYRRESPARLLLRKYQYFADEIYRNTGIDVRDERATVETLAAALTSKTGMERDGLCQLLDKLHKLEQHPDVKLDTDTMKQWIERMNEVLRRSR